MIEFFEKSFFKKNVSFIFDQQNFVPIQFFFFVFDLKKECYSSIEERRNRRLARDFCLSWPFNVSRGNRKQSGFHYCAHFRLVLFKLHQRINYSLLYPCPNAGKYRNVTLRCLFRIFNPIDKTNTSIGRLEIILF